MTILDHGWTGRLLIAGLTTLALACTAMGGVWLAGIFLYGANPLAVGYLFLCTAGFAGLLWWSVRVLSRDDERARTLGIAIAASAIIGVILAPLVTEGHTSGSGGSAVGRIAALLAGAAVLIYFVRRSRNGTARPPL